MSVLLTILPPWGRPTVPIGLGHLSQFLTDHGHAHQVDDLNLEIYLRVAETMGQMWQPQYGDDWVHPEKFKETLAQLQPHLEWAADRLAAADAEMVGFSINQSNARVSIEVARLLRQRRPNQIIVFGGLGVFIPGERHTIPEGIVDHFVIGEGELTLLRLVEKLEAGEPLAGTTGTISDRGQLECVPRPMVDLHRHPWPSYEKFQLPRYPGGGEPLPVGLTRGCVCRCSFCGDYPFWGKFRSRTGDQLVDEISHHVERHGVHRFEFNDLAINGDAAALEQMCDGIIQRGLDVQWSSYAYITSVTEQLADKLRRSGCVMLRFGMESASDSVLKRMRKPHRAALASEVLATLTAAGIHCNIGLMAGFPEETEDEVAETIAFLEANQEHIHEVDSLSVFYVKPLSYVDEHPDRFGMRFPDDHAIRWNRWVGEDGSTYERRVATAWRLAEAIEQTSIKFQRCNIIGM